VTYFERRRSERPDLIVYAGDDVRRFRPTLRINYFERLAALSRFGLVAVAGNDDGAKARDLITGRRVYEVHRTPVLLGNLLIVGLDGAPRRAGIRSLGSPLHTEAEIDAHVRAALSLRRDAEALIVSHAPPFGVLDASVRYGASRIGSTSLRHLVSEIRRVRVVVCGHSHASGGRMAWLGNATGVNAATHDRAHDRIRVAWCTWERAAGARRPDVWFDVVRPYEDLMQIDGIHEAHCERLWNAGVRTLGALARTTPARVGRVIGWRPEAVARYVHLARARRLGVPQPMAPFRAPPSPRVYFDIETDPWGGNRFCWLVGVYDEATDDFRQFVAEAPDKEARMLRAFAAYCRTLRGRPLVAYSGSDFDRQKTLKRLSAHGIGVRPRSSAAMISSTRCAGRSPSQAARTSSKTPRRRSASDSAITRWMGWRPRTNT
jgi:Icc-related predicted phosphoesterase